MRTDDLVRPRPADVETLRACVGCGEPLAEYEVVHFSAGRRRTTLELLCSAPGCERLLRPGAQPS